MPEPQRVVLRGGDFTIDRTWTISVDSSVANESSAVEELADGIKLRLGLTLRTGKEGRQRIELSVRPGTVRPEGIDSTHEAAVAEQAYRLELSDDRISITGNSETGLFYGAGTVVQLLTKGFLPSGEILDWPRLPLRHMYWDDSHHLERLAALKAAVREASFYKINGFVLKLDGHFDYASAPAVVEPEALSSEALQELTDYGLRYHVQVIPYLDAPAHVPFILKHPEYAALRAFPESDYEMCTANPASIELLHSMYRDLLNANRGVKYLYLSTDEAYYVGQADNAQCRELPRAKELGSPGKLWAEFLSEAASYLRERGREIIFWGEYPLKPGDITSVPPYLINGETSGDSFDPLYRNHGIRQMIYEPVEGEEQMFPHYYLLPRSRRLHAVSEDFERVPAALEDEAAVVRRGQSDLIGTIVAGWGDMGLHPETFWLGYTSVTAVGWRPWSGGASEAMASFDLLWYGRDARAMGRVYQLMSLQAETWSDTWDSKESTMRPGIWGDSNTIFTVRKPAEDQTIPLPGVPSSGLHYAGNWAKNNERRLELANEAMAGNDEVQNLLLDNLLHADFHRYDVEVFLSIARLCRQNLNLLESLARIDKSLAEASQSADAGKPEAALAGIDRALDQVRQIRVARNGALNNAIATWQKTWMPRVEEANGRRFLHRFDDVKDHLPERTVDMSYLVYRELLLPLGTWYEHTQTERNIYAAEHHLPESRSAFEWQDLVN